MELTETEKDFDAKLAAFIAKRRTEGRATYGTGLEHTAPYDWDRMALEEIVDFAQYLVAQNRRLNVQLAAGEADGFSWYQEMALRTARNDESDEKALLIRTLGLAGEAGEVADYVKKCAGHGHTLDRSVVEKELGDVLWYVATLADTLGLSMASIAKRNIEKLKARYPEGFSESASINRKA